jgi:hypothetical protein
MGWTSKVVVSPRIDNLMFTWYEGINCFYSRMFMTWIFCFAEDNKIIYGIENTITNRTEKSGLSANIPWKTQIFLLLLYRKTLCYVL